MMLDNSVLAEAKARQQGVKTRISIWPGMPHDFSLFPSLPESGKGIAELVRFARENSPARQSV
jgi:monoterpene epsilon-lactone hydrolase